MHRREIGLMAVGFGLMSGSVTIQLLAPTDPTIVRLTGIALVVGIFFITVASRRL